MTISLQPVDNQGLFFSKGKRRNSLFFLTALWGLRKRVWGACKRAESRSIHDRKTGLRHFQGLTWVAAASAIGMPLLAKALCLLGFAISHAAVPFVRDAGERHWESMKEWHRQWLAVALVMVPYGFLVGAMPDFRAGSEGQDEMTNAGWIAHAAGLVFLLSSAFRLSESNRK